MKITVSVDQGELRKLERRLNKLPEKTARRVFRSAGRKAMKIVQKEAIANAPSGKTGNLAEGILISLKERSLGVKGISLDVWLGLRLKPKDRSAWYGRLIETGWLLKLRGGGRKHIKARPFLRPAFHKNVRNMLKVFEKALRRSLDRLAK